MKTEAGVDSEELLRLYEVTVGEINFYLEAHQKRIEFYSGLVSALMTVTAVGLFQASNWYHYAYLCASPMLIYAVSTIAVQGTRRVYQRLLECITMRAKIEQALGLTDVLTVDKGTDSYWDSEPLVASRNIDSRKRYETSQAFVDAHLEKGLQLWATRLFQILQLLSAVLFVGFASLTVWRLLIL